MAQMPREDAVKYRDRYIVPTGPNTIWVSNWAEFRAAGGQICFNEDQTEVELRLPVDHKFSIRFEWESEQ